jgi:hypothetical protein
MLKKLVARVEKPTEWPNVKLVELLTYGPVMDSIKVYGKWVRQKELYMVTDGTPGTKLVRLINIMLPLGEIGRLGNADLTGV